MSRPKKPDAKIHITATIDPKNNAAIQKYRDDSKNRTPEGNQPTLSSVIDAALTGYLVGYL